MHTHGRAVDGVPAMDRAWVHLGWLVSGSFVLGAERRNYLHENQQPEISSSGAVSVRAEMMQTTLGQCDWTVQWAEKDCRQGHEGTDCSVRGAF